MKKNSKFLKNFIKKFLIYIFLPILLGDLFLAFTMNKDMNFFDFFYSFITNSIHSALILFIIFISLIVIICKLKNYVLIIRYKNYELYLKKILKLIICYVVLILLLDCFIIMIISLIKTKMSLQFVVHPTYNIPFILYILFHLIRKIIFIIMLSIIVVYLYMLCGKNISKMVVIIVGLIPIIHIHVGFVDNLIDVPLIITDYLDNILYSNVYLELSGTIIQFLILSLVIIILKKSFI